MKNRRFIPFIVYALVMLLVMSWASGLFTQRQDDLAYSELVSLFRKEQVKSFVVQDQAISLTLHSPYGGKTNLIATLADPESFRQEMIWCLTCWGDFLRKIASL